MAQDASKADAEWSTPGTVGGPPIHTEGAQLVVNGRTYLFDVGDQALWQMARLGLAVPSANAMFLTHVVPGVVDVKDLPGRIALIRQGYDGEVVGAEDPGRSSPAAPQETPTAAGQAPCGCSSVGRSESRTGPDHSATQPASFAALS